MTEADLFDPNRAHVLLLATEGQLLFNSQDLEQATSLPDIARVIPEIRLHASQVLGPEGLASITFSVLNGGREDISAEIEEWLQENNIQMVTGMDFINTVRLRPSFRGYRDVPFSPQAADALGLYTWLYKQYLCHFAIEQGRNQVFEEDNFLSAEESEVLLACVYADAFQFERRSQQDEWVSKAAFAVYKKLLKVVNNLFAPRPNGFGIALS